MVSACKADHTRPPRIGVAPTWPLYTSAPQLVLHQDRALGWIGFVAMQRTRFLLRRWWHLFALLFFVLAVAAWCVLAGTAAIKTGVETWEAQQSGIPAHVVVTGCHGPKGGHCVAIWQKEDGTAEQVEVVGAADRDEGVDVRIVGNRAYQTDLYNRLSGLVGGSLLLLVLPGLLIVVIVIRRHGGRVSDRQSPG